MVRDYLQNDVGLDSQQLARRSKGSLSRDHDRRTIADCPEVLEVFSVETLKEKAGLELRSFTANRFASWKWRSE